MNAVHNGLPPGVPIFERERRTDRFVELLECLADLRVAAARRRIEIAESIGVDPAPQAGAVAQRLTEVERSLNALSAEAAAVHRALQHAELMRTGEA